MFGLNSVVGWCWLGMILLCVVLCFSVCWEFGWD